MRRLSKDEIEQLKSGVPILDLIRSSGVKLERKGADYFGRCPDHDDRTPSLVVSPNRGLWHCLGACQTGGTVLDWVMRRNALTFRQAVDHLLHQFPLAASSSGARENRMLDKPTNGPVDEPQLMRRVMDHYIRTFKDRPEAAEYLASRSLVAEGLIDTFQIGYADGGLLSKLPDPKTSEGKEIRHRLRRVGILRRNNQTEHFAGCVVAPLFAEDGAIVGMYGRRLTSRPTKHLYLAGQHRGLFNRPALKSEALILCESIFDAMSFFVAGFPNVTTTYGASDFSRELLFAMIDGGVKTVYLAHDGDAAGDAGASRVAEELAKLSTPITPLRVVWPRAFDANMYLQSLRISRDNIRLNFSFLLVEQARYMGSGPDPRPDGKAIFPTSSAPSSSASDSTELPKEEASKGMGSEAPRAPASANEPAPLPPASPSSLPLEDAIKRSVAIDVLIEMYGVELTRQGDELVGSCPLHGEDSPSTSLRVDPKTGAWTCISCGAGGSAIEWTMIIHELSSTDAMRKLEREWLEPKSSAAASSSGSSSSERPEEEAAKGNGAEAPRAPLPARAPTPLPPSAPIAADPEPGRAAPLPPPSPLAAPAPAAAAAPATPSIPELRPEGLHFGFGDRRYRVRGLEKCLSYGVMKLNLFVQSPRAHFIDTVDLSSAKSTRIFVEQAADRLGFEPEAIQADVGQLLLKLEQIQEHHIKKTLEPKDQTVVLSPEEEKEALELLKDPRLLDRVLEVCETSGVVGERTNKLISYLAATSRRLKRPLAVIIQSSSSAGKTALMDNIINLMPDEQVIKLSAMTGQSLYYMGDLKNKILAIVEEEGAERASYALKLLQSEQKLSIAATGKDPITNRLVTHEYRVEGPVVIFLASTAVDIDEELLNRVMILSIDESREQTQAIHRFQRKRETLEGLLAEEDAEDAARLFQNAQRLLRPLRVINPFAESLSFVDHQMRHRRDNMKYLILQRSIALLHQYQRPVKTMRGKRGKRIEYIEILRSDIALADELFESVLGLADLPPHTEKLLGLLQTMVSSEAQRRHIDRKDVLFSRREVAAYTGWSYFQVRAHMNKLLDLEYVIAHSGRRGQSFRYELVVHGTEPAGSGRPLAGEGGGEGEKFEPPNGKFESGNTQSLSPGKPNFEPPLSPH